MIFKVVSWQRSYSQLFGSATGNGKLYSCTFVDNVILALAGDSTLLRVFEIPVFGGRINSLVAASSMFNNRAPEIHALNSTIAIVTSENPDSDILFQTFDSSSFLANPLRAHSISPLTGIKSFTNFGGTDTVAVCGIVSERSTTCIDIRVNSGVEE